jgi:hypothetical protein
MEADTQAHVAFFLTGRRPSEHLDSVDGLDLRPALFAGYRDLTPLRYDFPLVLQGEGADPVASLSGLFDKALAKVATGSDGERIRKHGLRLEQEIRAVVAGGATGTLSEVWERAAARAGSQADASFEDSWRRLRTAINADGPVVDCDAALPRQLLRHVWETAQAGKAAQFRQQLQRLVLKLSAILQSDFEQSAKGMAADRLQASMGGAFANTFDFEAMSRLLVKSQPRESMPAARKRRITELLRVLKSQRFFAGGAESDASAKPYTFTFDSCTAALKAYRERQPRQTELARALVVAELEIEGEYNPERHDAVFEAYGEAGLDSKEVAAFPAYLVCIDDAGLDAQENARLMEILSSGLPIKVLLQVDDLTDTSAVDQAGQAPGLRSRQLASLAMGLNAVYVLQSSASNLFQFRERVLKGVGYPGPAFFSVYSGANAKAGGLPPYLMAAAAMESRAFPAFVYDPSAGPNWAARFCLQSNSQVELDWPVKGFAYEDEQHQSVSQDLAFTLVDFLAADQRYAGHLARVPREKWNGSMIPVDESLAKERKGLPDKVPSLLMVDAENRLQKVIVAQSLIRQASRCREMWHSLQELGGVHNSHAQNLLAREQKIWQERAQKEAEAAATSAPKLAPSASVTAPVATTAAAPAAVETVEEPERNPDEAYIETARCSTCNECTLLNSKMFAYDGNQQAYIADINAGTYAQLVEAAENCQVSVIHPGKPRNANEPGLDELLKRAEAFL